MNYVIAIPSYQRAITLDEKTLRLLKDYKIPKEKIYIFVANQYEYEEYTNTIDLYYNKIIIGEKGMGNIRNFMTDYFEQDQKIFYLDDDINFFYQCYNDKNVKNKSYNYLKKLPDLDKFIKQGFNILEKENCNLFGVYPIRNSYFMKPENYSTDLKYCIGFCYGVINQKDLKVTLDDKEDFQRSLLYYIKDNKIVRFNNITCGTICYKKNSGGMNDINRTKERIHKSAEYLVENYPDLCSLKISKKRGTSEIRLKDKKRIK
jgi:hypothetical protein